LLTTKKALLKEKLEKRLIVFCPTGANKNRIPSPKDLFFWATGRSIGIMLKPKTKTVLV
jgi:hypothetical protein